MFAPHTLPYISSLPLALGDKFNLFEGPYIAGVVPATLIAEVVLYYHQDLAVIIIGLSILIAWLLFKALYSFTMFGSHWLYSSEMSCEVFDNYLTSVYVRPLDDDDSYERQVEGLFTIIPAFFLGSVFMPTMSVVYTVDGLSDSMLSTKAVGNQWFWGFEYSSLPVDDVHIEVPNLNFSEVFPLSLIHI